MEVWVVQFMCSAGRFKPAGDPPLVVQRQSAAHSHDIELLQMCPTSSYASHPPLSLNSSSRLGGPGAPPAPA
jgi:hypothetical protein